MLKLIQRLVSWARRLLAPAPAALPSRDIFLAVPACLSWPLPRLGKTGVAAIRRAAIKARNRRRARHV